MADTATLYLACLAGANWLRTQAKEHAQEYGNDIGDFLFVVGVEVAPAVLITLNLFLVRLREGYDSLLPDSNTRAHTHFARYTATSWQRSSGIAAIIISTLFQLGLIARYRLEGYVSSRPFPLWLPLSAITTVQFLYRLPLVIFVVLCMRLWAYYPFIREMLDCLWSERHGFGVFIVSSIVCLCIWAVQSALVNPITLRRHSYDRWEWRLWAIVLFQLCCCVGYGLFMIGRWLDYKDYNPSSVIFTVLLYFFAWMYLVLWFNVETKEENQSRGNEAKRSPAEGEVKEKEEIEDETAEIASIGETDILLRKTHTLYT